MESAGYPKADTELTTQLLDLVQQAAYSKVLKKGANEAVKALNKGRAELVLIAADTEPPEIVLHLPILCEDKNVPFVFVPEMVSLGRSAGSSRPVIAVAVLAGENTQIKNQTKTLIKEIEKIRL
ncbi:MAG: small nucleolar ribonucleoprotein Snu13 [Amphiamblys sp. WSBS2006]|nr:MAG: small nucleolar ribonucleoprotein Snu13 [Amphiamblys sp. WSBS2006]